MGLDNPPTDGQPQTGTLRFRGEERLENMIASSDRKADT